MPTTQTPVLQRLSELVNHKAEQLTYLTIDPTHAGNASPGTEPRPIEPGKDYFRLWLNEMWLSRDQHWLRDVYPVVHSTVALDYGGQTVELPYVAGPLNLKGVNIPSLGHTISLNHKLTTLLPFNGGTVELEAGLLAVPGQDVVGSLLGVLGDFSSLIVAPQLSGAVKVAEKVSSGLQAIANPETGKLHLGLHQAFAGAGSPQQLTPSHLVVIRAPSGSIDPGKLWIVNNRLHHGTSAANSAPLNGYDYMLFQIETTSERDDWNSFTTIETPLNAALGALASRDESTAQVHLQTAKKAAINSHDFTRVDRFRVCSAIDKTFSEMKEALAPRDLREPRETISIYSSGEPTTKVHELKSSTPVVEVWEPLARFETSVIPPWTSVTEIRLSDVMKNALTVNDAALALRDKPHWQEETLATVTPRKERRDKES